MVIVIILVIIPNPPNLRPPQQVWSPQMVTP